MYNTSSESISNFIKWAQERIAREVQENEKIEEESGEANYLPDSVFARFYTKQDKLNAINGVNYYRDQGMRMPAACKKYGISTSSYGKWRRELKLSVYKRK
jgi:hypothetical protein